MIRALIFPFLLQFLKKKTDEVKSYLDLKADPNASDFMGVTALMYAIMSEDPEIVELLYELGADVDAADIYGTSVLMYTVITNNEDIFDLLFPEIDKINKQSGNGNTALIYAAQIGNVNFAQQLIDRGADVSITNRDGLDALMFASAFGHFTMTDMILFYGGDPERSARDGSTALHFAALYGHYEIAGLLMESGADPEAKDNFNNTPLMVSVFGRNLETAWYMIESGAEPGVVNLNNHTPLAIAAGLNDEDMVNLITSYDFDEPVIYQKRNTALFLAYINKNPSIARRITKFQGFSPKGLYFSELNTESGFSFNKNELMYGFGTGLFESRYRIFTKLSWYKRTRPRVANIAQTDDLVFRYLEERTIWTLSFQRELSFFRYRAHELGGLAGIGMLFSYARYNGTDVRPDPAFALAPAIDIFYRYRWFGIFGSYTFFRTGVNNVPADRFQAGVRFHIPLYRPAALIYNPLIR
jgi:ankyrin repeat protein